jgi:hypothetical protein
MIILNVFGVFILIFPPLSEFAIDTLHALIHLYVKDCLLNPTQYIFLL